VTSSSHPTGRRSAGQHARRRCSVGRRRRRGPRDLSSLSRRLARSGHRRGSSTARRRPRTRPGADRAAKLPGGAGARRRRRRRTAAGHDTVRSVATLSVTPPVSEASPSMSSVLAPVVEAANHPTAHLRGLENAPFNRAAVRRPATDLDVAAMTTAWHDGTVRRGSVLLTIQLGGVHPWRHNAGDGDNIRGHRSRTGRWPAAAAPVTTLDDAGHAS